MHFSLLAVVLSGCSLFDAATDDPVPEPSPEPVAAPISAVAAPAPTSGYDGCRLDASALGLFRVGPPDSVLSVGLEQADDWQVDCTRTEDPDGAVQLLSASSESLNSSAYALSLPNPSTDAAQAALETALAEMRQVWEMDGSVDIDRPYPDRPVAVVRANDNAQTHVTWQVVTVSKSPAGNWVRIHQTWSCNDCGLDAMGTKYKIDAMVSATDEWGFPR